MEVIKIYPENPNPKEINKVVNVLKEGGLIVYPTDTVYAIGCDALNVRAVERILQFQNSVLDKETIHPLVGDSNQVLRKKSHP